MKTITLGLAFLLLASVKLESFDENEMPDMEDEFPEPHNDSISDIDSTEFVSALQKQLSSMGERLSHSDCVTLLLMIYSESSREDI